MKRFFSFFVAALLFFGTLFYSLPTWADHISDAEIEQFVRARIDMGESMKNFFRNRKPPKFGPEGGPSMEELRNLEAEINNHIAGILSKHDLSIESYRGRSAEVFEDEEGVQNFLSSHPDLQSRYEAIPKSRGGGRYAH